MTALVNTVRSHYDDLGHISDDIRELGFPRAAEILRQRLPQRPRARSGEIGEILATEFVEFVTDFVVPVRRLRYKDGRDMALRGDDFIGVQEIGSKGILLLKGEAKSRQRLRRSVVDQARVSLSSCDGRPTPISLLFVADRLIEFGGSSKELGRKLRQQVAHCSVESDRITHTIFVLSEDVPRGSLRKDLEAADEDHRHISACILISGHGEFVNRIYEEVGDLGDD